ncbi:fimbrial biogenesis chaperone [Tsuneonella sp. SYSU-LHT278]|uniref:fimbrial biogenesis chaperone n=1 Tax=Tsuneonella sediminis TaxID=3416089 RepID=UPI003F78BECC
MEEGGERGLSPFFTSVWQVKIFEWTGRMTILVMLRQRWCAIIAALALMTAAGAAYAMRVSPMVIEMESRGSTAVARLEVQNINRGNLAFETRVYRMTLDADGNIIEVPADDQFLIFPPQGALAPGGRQVVRLQWVGAADLAASEAFYVSVNQLPVAFAPGTEDSVAAQVQVVYNMRALVVVAPPGAAPNVQATSVEPITYTPPSAAETETPPRSVPGLAVTLANTGRRHAMMSEFNWRFEGTDPNGKPLRIDVSAEELNRHLGTGYVPALGQRTFRLPVMGFGTQPIKLSFFR